MNQIKKFYFKARIILSVLITIIAIVVTNKYWLIIKPMHVSFDINGSGICNVEVLLNKKDNDKFKKVKRENIEINLEETNHADLYVERSKFPKRVKFIISKFEPDKKIIISNIKVGKSDIDNLGEFEILGATATVQNNELILNPAEVEISIINPKTLKVMADIQIDFKVLIIILILTYLLSYKLLNYIANFKTVQNNSRLDIVFLIIFFIFLFIPMSHISQDEISIQENRTLAKWQSLINKNGEINYNFGKDFNEWFNDRFALRSVFVKTWDYFTYTVSKRLYVNKNFVLNKQNNWMGNLNEIKKSNYIEQSEIDKAAANIKRIQNLCNKHNIKLYILVIPHKEEFYSKQIFGYDYSYMKQTMQMADYISKNTNVPIIIPYNELRQLSQKNYAYFKTDHHWTDEGAYIGYKELMKEIKKSYSDIHISNENDFDYSYSKQVRVIPGEYNNGETYRILEVNNPEILDTEYKYFKHKDFEKVKMQKKDIKNGGTEYQYKYNINAPILYIFGDSFTLNLLQFFPYSFKDVKNVFIPIHYEHADLKLYEKDIISSDSNILVLCFSGLERLAMLYKD